MDFNLFLYNLIRSDFLHELPSALNIVLILLQYALFVTGMWKVFEKAGKKGFYALIPFYNYHLLFEIAWEGRCGILFNVLDILYMVLSFGAGNLLTKGFRGILSLLFFAASFILLAIAKIKLARSFDRGALFSYGLIFMETIFLLILGFNKAQYLGPTLRKYSKDYINRQNKVRIDSSAHVSRRYMISLYKKRSIVAFIAGTLAFALSFRAIAGGLVTVHLQQIEEPGYSLFHFFTINSNILSGIGAAFLIPYAIEGIRKKRFVFPKWITLFQYSGAICTTLTMLFSILFIFPTQGPEMAFQGMNFWLHIVCPIMALLLLFMVETDVKLSVSETLFCMLPFFLYTLIYITNVVLLGEEYGGWRDIYLVNTYVPAVISAPLMYMFALGVAFSIRYHYNRFVKIRHEQFISMWDDNASEVEINIEVYGLGKYNGERFETNNIAVPIDIFEALSKKYGMDVSKLCSIYNKGLIDGIKQHRDLSNMGINFSYVFGVPEKIKETNEK